MNRIISIIMTELASDVLKHEEAMESEINNKTKAVEDRIQSIKYHLSEIVKNEMMIEKWRGYTSQNNNNE